jgi:hypothetical protein
LDLGWHFMSCGVEIFTRLVVSFTTRIITNNMV